MHRLRKELSNFLDQVKDLRTIYQAGRRQGHGLGVFHEDRKLVEAFLDVHGHSLGSMAGLRPT
jgi:hypothetical protein